MKPPTKYYPWLLLLPTLALLVAITVYPFIYAIRLSFFQYNIAKYYLGQTYVGLSNFVNAFADSLFLNSLKNTFLLMGGGILIQFVLGLGVALLLAQKLRGISVIRGFIILPLLLPPIVAGLLWRFLFNNEVGLVIYYLRLLGLWEKEATLLGKPSTALLGIMIADSWQWTPLISLILFAGIRALPQEPFEAAELDGASAWQKFVFLTLPLLRPLITIALLIRIIDLYRIYDQVYVMTYGGPGSASETASFYVYRQGFVFFRMGYASSLSIILLIICILLSMAFVRVLLRVEER